MPQRLKLGNPIKENERKENGSAWVYFSGSPVSLVTIPEFKCLLHIYFFSFSSYFLLCPLAKATDPAKTDINHDRRMHAIKA